MIDLLFGNVPITELSWEVTMSHSRQSLSILALLGCACVSFLTYARIRLHPEHGLKANSIKAEIATEALVQSSSDFTLLISCNAYDIESLRNTVKASRLATKLKPGKITIIAITSGNPQTASQIVAKELGAGEIPPRVESLQFLHSVGLSPNSFEGRGLMLLAGREVRFAANAMRYEDIATVFNTYMDSPAIRPVAAALSTGKVMPEAFAEDILSQNRTPVNIRTLGNIVVVPASCPACNLDRLPSKLQSAIQGMEQLDAVVFSSKFLMGELQKFTAALGPQTRILRLISPLPGIELTHFDGGLFEADALWIKTKKARLSQITPIGGATPLEEER